MYHSLFIHMPIDEFLHYFEIIVTNSVRMYCYCCLVAKSYLTLYGHMDCGSSIHGNSQARILEWVAIAFSGELPNPGIEPASPALAGEFFTSEPPGKPSLGPLRHKYQDEIPSARESWRNRLHRMRGREM